MAFRIELGALYMPGVLGKYQEARVLSIMVRILDCQV